MQHGASVDQFVVKGVLLHQTNVPGDFPVGQRAALMAVYSGGKPILIGRVNTSGADTKI